MEKTVIGVFTSRESAEKAVKELRTAGFDREISILAKDSEEPNRFNNGTAATGAISGGVLGGIAGIMLGAGALAIPGMGAVIAAGPIAGLLSGAATGGIAGSLVDWGIPKDRGDFYEGEVKHGNIVAAVKTADTKVDKASAILKHHGTQNLEIH